MSDKLDGTHARPIRLSDRLQTQRDIEERLAWLARLFRDQIKRSDARTVHDRGQSMGLHRRYTGRTYVGTTENAAFTALSVATRKARPGMDIRKKLVELCHAFNAHDLDRIISCFAHDCVFTSRFLGSGWLAGTVRYWKLGGTHRLPNRLYRGRLKCLIKSVGDSLRLGWRHYLPWISRSARLAGYIDVR
jgi:hypothetical protein